ncbi:MAG TPA: cell wall hydrolase [Sphingomicrobium sp.]|nr:cell wall hydrolase [Sphingomicrobium sp.]
MIKLLGSRGASAVVGLFMLATASGASAQIQATAAVPAQAGAVDATVKPLRTSATVSLGNGQSVQATYAGAIAAAVSTPAAALTQLPFAMAQSLPLSALVAFNSVGAELDDEAHCVAVAVYHEARGESLEGQLAVARVIMNRTASPKYPDSWCKVVKQPWQFSFVNPRTGRYPAVNERSEAWTKAQAITRIAMANAAPILSDDVLWYHADYVAPSWGRRLNVVEKIGTHIFYRA